MKKIAFILFLLSLSISIPAYADKSAENLAEVRTKAEQGDAKAQNYLAVMYIEGKGVPQNDAEGLKWYRKAADQGLAVAQWSLGMNYFYGDHGVSQDNVEAEKWFRRAANQGSQLAEFYLGVVYSGGLDGKGLEGIKPDKDEAYFWLTLGGKIGDKRRIAIESIMRPEEISEIKKRALDWKPTAESTEH